MSTSQKDSVLHLLLLNKIIFPVVANIFLPHAVKARPFSGVCADVNYIPLDAQVYHLKPAGIVKAHNGGTDWKYFAIDNRSGYRPDYPVRFFFDVQDTGSVSHFHVSILAVGDIPREFNNKKYVISIEHQDGSHTNLSFFGIGDCRKRTVPQESVVGNPKSITMFEVKMGEKTLV